MRKDSLGFGQSSWKPKERRWCESVRLRVGATLFLQARYVHEPLQGLPLSSWLRLAARNVDSLNKDFFVYRIIKSHYFEILIFEMIL